MRKDQIPLQPGTHVLVTGGAGFLGSHLVEALLDRGCMVSVIDDLSTGRFDNIAHLENHPTFRFAIDSVTNEAVLDHLVRDSDVIFHLAAAVGVELIIRDPVRVLESNIFGTRAVLHAANRYRKRLLITSTSEVYGKSENVPFGEEDDSLVGPTTKARWSYAASKAANEHLCLAYQRQMGLPVVIFRLFNTVGPRQSGQYGMVIPRLVRQAVEGRPLTVYGDGTQRRCFCDVEDAVRAMLAVAEHPAAWGQIFNIGSDQEVSILELAQQIAALVDFAAAEEGKDERSQIEFVPYETAYGPGFEDMRRRQPNLSRIRRLIGWEPRIPLAVTLRRVIAHYRLAASNSAYIPSTVSTIRS